jgi:hypothetical protein
MVNTKTERSTEHWVKVATTVALKLMLTLIVIKLSWNCNHNMNIILRLIVTAISCLFSEIYIIYYAFYRLYLGNTCPI